MNHPDSTISPLKQELRLLKVALLLSLATFASRQLCANSFVLDRNDFNGSVTATASSDLEGLVGTAAYPQNYPFGSGYYNTLSTGISVENARFLGSASGAPETYILGSDVGSGTYSLNGSFALLLGRQQGEIYLPAGVTAFGADFGVDSSAPAGGLSLTFTAYLRDGTTEQLLTTMDHAGQFVGFTGSEIDHIEITKTGGSLVAYTLLDDFVYGTAAAPGGSGTSVPEGGPGTVLTAALLGVLFYHSRRHGATRPN